MAIRSHVDNTTLRTIRLEVKVNKEEIADAIGFTASFGFSQVNKHFVLRCRTRNQEVVAGAEIEAWIYINGSDNGAKIFYGEVTKEDWKAGPKGFEKSATGKLARLRNAWGGAERTYEDQDDAAVIRNLIEAHGIAASEMRIESSSWTLGTIDPVVLTENDVAWNLIEEIDEIAGFVTYERINGIYRHELALSPGVTPKWTYTRGVNILKGAQRTLDTTGIVNKIMVEGLNYEGLSDIEAEYSAPNEYLLETMPTNPYIAHKITSNLIETPDKATAVARDYVNKHNRLPEVVTLPVLGNPLIDPGDTIKVTDSDLELTNAMLLVTDVKHSLEGAKFRTTITAIGANLGGLRLQAPIADYELTMFKQAKDSGSGPVAFAGCRANAAKSTDPDGDETLMTYAWTVSGVGGTPSPTSGTGVTFLFTLPAATTSITLQLTVTDSDGLTNVLSKTFTVDFAAMPVEDLWRIENGLLGITIDGGMTWLTQSIASGNGTCLMPIAKTWQACGTSTGHIYASFDKCKAALTDLGTPNGAVAVGAVWIHELEPTRCWAAFADGKVYFGQVDTTAKTAVWTLKGTAPATPIREIRESYGTVFGELRIAAGNGYYISRDSGATWTVLKTSAGTAMRMAAGFETNAIAFDGDAAPVQYEEAGNPAFPVLVPVVDSIRAITPGLTDKEFYAADNQTPARTFRSNDTLTTYTRVGDMGQRANHMIRSNNKPKTLYAAVGDGSGTTAGVMKSDDGGDTWFYVYRGGTTAVHMVGAGGSHLPEVIARTEIISPTFGLASSNGVYHFVPAIGGVPASWALKNSGLPSGQWWGLWICANPFNQSEWLLLINTANSNTTFERSGTTIKCADGSTSPLWRSNDDGGSWSAVTLTESGATPESMRLFQVEFSRQTPGEWFLTGTAKIDVTTARGIFLRGTGNASTSSFVDNDWSNPQFAIPGLAGDVIIAEEDSPGTGLGNFGRIGVISPGTDNIADVLGGMGEHYYIERGRGLSRSLYGANRSFNEERVLYFKDYGSPPSVVGTSYAILSNGPAYWLTVAANGDVLVGGERNSDYIRRSILRLTNFSQNSSGTGATETVIAATVLTSPEGIGMVRAGRPTGAGVAARIVGFPGTDKTDFFTSDDSGATWVRVTGPVTTLANRLEVLER